MINPYLRPMDTIELQRDTVNVGAGVRLNTLVIGVQYMLSRYGVEDVQAVGYAGAGTFALKYVKDGDEFALPTDVVVDQTTLELYGSALLAQAAAYPVGNASNNAFRIDDLARPNRIRHGGANNLSGGTLLTELNGRAVQIGDTVLVDDGVGGAGRFNRKVIGLIGRIVAADYGTDNNKSDGLFAEAVYNPITSVAAATAVSATFADATGDTADISFTGTFGSAGTARVVGALHNGEFAELYTVTCLIGGAPGTATVKITSASGNFDVASVATVNSAGNYSITHAVLNGLTIVIASDVLLVAGDVFQVRAVGAYTRATSGTPAITASGTYTGNADTTFVVQTTAASELAAASHTFRIYDTGGLYETIEVTKTDISTVTVLATIGGIAISVDAQGTAGFRKGDNYFIHATCEKASTTEFNGLVLDGPAADTTLFTNIATNLDVILAFDAEGLIDESWVATGDPWTFDDSDNTIDLALLSVTNGETEDRCQLITGYGNIHSSFRAAIQPTATESLIPVSQISDFTQLGTVDPLNELAFGVNNAFDGSEGQRVYALRVGAQTQEAWAASLLKIESTDVVYALNALTQDAAIRDLAKQHVLAMSTKEKKQFRRTYLGVSSPGRYKLLDKQVNLQPYTVTVSAYGGSNKLVTFQQADVDLVALKVRQGDEVILPVDGTVGIVDQVLTAKELLLKVGLPAPVSPAVPVQIWKADTPQNTCDFIIAAAKALAHERVILVWVEGGTKDIGGRTQVIHPMFVASEIAGARCLFKPQRGMTMHELSSITSAAPMYTRYTQDQLDQVAANGVWIVTQEVDGGPVFCRHQLTTNSSDGILAYEDSIGVNQDDLAYKTKDAFSSFRGRRNVTPQTRREIEDTLTQIYIDASQSEVGDEDGPQVVDFADKNGELNKVTVEVDPNFADRFRTYVDAGVPVPLNGIHHVIRISISDLI